MSPSILALVALLVIVASLAAVIVVCARMLRKAGWGLKRLPRPGRSRHQAKISADEIIDLHLALKDVESLREIADQIPA